MKASLNDYRQSPRKVRLVANLMKGKRIDAALTVLSFMEKSAAAPIKKLIESAIANAKSAEIETADLYIKTIEVNPGQVLKRRMPRARGTAYPIKKRTSHIDLVLGEAPVSKKAQVKSAKRAKQLAEAKK